MTAKSAFCVTAIFLAGVVFQYSLSRTAVAQTPVVAPREVRAQSFVLVDEAGRVQGTLSFVKTRAGSAAIKLDDADGREIWRVGGGSAHLLDGSKTPR